MSIRVTWNASDSSATAETKHGSFYICYGPTCDYDSCWDVCEKDKTDEEIEDEIEDMELEVFDELKEAALSEVRKRWNYNGSNWTPPVERPDVEPDDERIEGGFAMVRTAFHGGGLIGWFPDEETADAWVDYKLQGSDCKCGCYCVVSDEDFDKLPTNANDLRDPYAPCA